MGLDNLPITAACVAEHGELFAGQAGCAEAADAGLCPWKLEFGDREGAVLGIFGSPCWYRGRFGNWALEAVTAETGEKPPVTWYGTGKNPDDPGELTLDPDECTTLAAWMEARVEPYVKARLDDAQRNDYDGNGAFDEWKYAADWLRWTAANCGGSSAWY